MSESQVAQPEFEFSSHIDVLLRRRWIALAVFVLSLLSTALYVFSVRPRFQASALLDIEKERGGTAVISNGAVVEASNEDYYQTQYRLLKSDSLLQTVYDDLKLQNTQDFSNPDGLRKFADSVTIAPVLRSRLVQVLVVSHDPALAASIANSLANAFVEQNLTNQLFISKEVLKALQANTETPEGRHLQEGLPAVVNSPLIQNLKADYAKLQSQAADMSRRYTPKHPLMMALRANLEALNHQISEETDRIVQSMKTDLSGQLKGNNVRVVDPAKPPNRPVSPRKVRDIILAALSGLCLGMIAAFAVEALDQSIRTQEDVEAKLGQPYLGAIPYLPQKPDSRTYDSLLGDGPSLTSESFRNLRTMLDFAGVGGKAQRLLVTSTVQEEGKTYIASNLAVALAQLGERVLLIEGDLRRPKVHKTFRTPSERGVSEFLASARNAEEIESLVQKTDVPNLHALPCGTRPPNPSELLNTPKLKALVSWASSQFDRVVVDCTPMFPIHDTLLWGRNIQSVVFVTRYGKTRAPLIKSAQQRIQAGGMRLMGVAVNAATPLGLSYSAYGYHYRQYYHHYYDEAHTSKA